MINDRKMPRKIKVKLYKTIIRPVMIHEAEMWTGMKSKTSRAETAEMKMLKRIMNVTLLDRKRSEDIRRELGVGDIKGKMREAKLRWYGHMI